MTRRQEIIKLLQEDKFSAQTLANMFKVELKEIIDDLFHISNSEKLKREPAYCKKCGFVFRERSRIKAPSRCPKCKMEWIEPCLFFIKS